MREIKSQDHLDNMARQGTPARTTTVFVAVVKIDAAEQIVLVGATWQAALDAVNEEFAQVLDDAEPTTVEEFEQLTDTELEIAETEVRS
jgi:hypothetical protein